MSYRGRIAPSPTGYLHAGHARTFWTAFLRAQKHNPPHHGTLVLRNEDLDPDRSKPEFTQAMLEDLHWLGIRWSEGPQCNKIKPEGPQSTSSQAEGPYGPYAQSRRRNFYLDAWRRLVASGHVYPCTCSRKDLQRAAQAPHEDTQPPNSQTTDPQPADEEPIYPGPCRPKTPTTHPNAPTFQPPQSPAGLNWRFRVPDGESVTFTDAHFGPQSLLAGHDFGDFLVWRRDDVPAYQLAVVVDDHLMRITEVVRGQDLLVSTARQILLYRALGWTPPEWYHCPLVTDSHGRRLAKRHHALSIRTLRQQGQTPAQILNLE